MIKRLKKAFRKSEGWIYGKDRDRRMFRESVRTSRPFSFLYNGSFNDFSKLWVGPRRFGCDSEVKEIQVDVITSEEQTLHPPSECCSFSYSAIVTTEEARKDLDLYHNGSHPAINGPWPWDNLQQFRNVLAACIITKMTMCEIGQFLGAMCHRKDKPLDGLITVMVNDQYTYCEIGRTVLMCFGPRDEFNNPDYGGVDKGNEDLRPDPPTREYVVKVNINPSLSESRYCRRSPLSYEYEETMGPHMTCPTPESKIRLLKEDLVTQNGPLCIRDSSTRDNDSIDGGKVIADGLRLRRLPPTASHTGSITRSKTMIPHRVTGIEGSSKPIDMPKRASSLRNMSMKRNSEFCKNYPSLDPLDEERSAWDEDSDNENTVMKLTKSFSLRHSRRLSWVSGPAKRRHALSDSLLR